MKRETMIGNTGTGKSARSMREMDILLLAHPGKKVLIVDSKTGKKVTRYFVPNLQIGEKKES